MYWQSTRRKHYGEQPVNSGGIVLIDVASFSDLQRLLILILDISRYTNILGVQSATGPKS